MRRLLHFFFGDRRFAQSTPSINDVGSDEWNDERDARHNRKGEMTRRTIANGERTIDVE